MLKRNLLNDKQGDLTGVLYLIASVAAFAIFLLIVGFIGSTVGTEIKNQIGSDRIEINNSFDKTIQVSTSGLSAIWFIVFFGLIIGLMISAWLMPTYPIFAVPFFILLIIAIIVGVSLSNAYEVLAAQANLATTSAQQGLVGFLMGKLPYIALIIGLLTAIITFAKPGRFGGPQTPIM